MIQLSDHFTYEKMLRFTLPSVTMMMFTSIYGIVDGYFISNYAKETAFAAVNLILPCIMILSTPGFMVGAGGTAYVSRAFGQGDKETANGVFSMLIYGLTAVGTLMAIIGYFSAGQLTKLLGANPAMFDDCVLYMKINMVSLPMYMLLNAFAYFFVAAERPKLGLANAVAAGVTNMVLDVVFVGIMKQGVAGAAWATVIGEYVGGGTALAYFIFYRSGILRLGRPLLSVPALIQSLYNGSSELMSEMSKEIVSMAFNFQLMRYVGETGVAAYGVIMYVEFIFTSVFYGYSSGISPVISYHYGAENKEELKSLRHRSLILIIIAGVFMTVSATVLAGVLSRIFVGYNEQLMHVTTVGLRTVSLSFFPTGFVIFTSGFFTALNNGGVSATISFLQSLLLPGIMVTILPIAFGLMGIWSSIVVAGVLSMAVAVFFLKSKQARYGY